MKTFKELFLTESEYDFSTDQGVAKFVLDNMKNLKFRKDGDVSYSKKYDGYKYDGDSKIKGMTFETSWSHQSDKFTVMFNASSTEAMSYYNQIKEFKDVLDRQFDIQCENGSGEFFVTFGKNCKKSTRLVGEFADNITGYSKEDL